jgi:hypothetical protein
VTTRVALVNLPGLLVDVVLDALATEPGVEVAVLPAGSPTGRILKGNPDVVMIGVQDPEHCEPSAELLRGRPGLGLFAISPDAREAWIHELCPRARRLEVVSGPSLRAAVRGVRAGQRP